VTAQKTEFHQIPPVIFVQFLKDGQHRHRDITAQKSEYSLA